MLQRRDLEPWHQRFQSVLLFTRSLIPLLPLCSISKKCGISVSVFSMKTVALCKMQGRNYKIFFSFRRNPSLCKWTLKSHKNKHTKLFSFSFSFHFLTTSMRTEIFLCCLNTSEAHFVLFFSSSDVEATFSEFSSPEQKRRLPCVHVSVKKGKKTKNVWAVAMVTGFWMTWCSSHFFRWVFFPNRSRPTAAAGNIIAWRKKDENREKEKCERSHWLTNVWLIRSTCRWN